MQTFVVAGGCFWCLDAVYRTLRGVTEVVSGYTGGTVAEPSYDLVTTGTTGHAEAVAVTFDPETIPAEVILDVFFSLHDPTQLNRQGADVGSQYRSALFYADDDQKALFEAARLRAAEWWDDPVVTQIDRLGSFFVAEDYHQDFFAKNPGQGYCLAIAAPKVRAIRKSFAKYALAQ
jgi:peptide-methionine (S)-S-oxide reductase